MKANALSGLLHVALISPLLLLAASRLPDGEITASVNPTEGRVEWSYRGRKLLDYAFAANQFKSYVRELRTLGGDNVLRDAPADHLHHHGLMYAIRINGVNFWEEVGECGHERSVKLLAQPVDADAAGHPRARFTQWLHWVAHTNRALADTAPVALLIEKRTLTLTVNEADGEVALEWRGDFEAGPGAANLRLHGSDYNGLGLRLPVEFDHAARHLNSENVPYKEATQRDVITARWSAVAGSVGNHDITVAIFARPEVMAGTTRFFTMLDPFCYLSVTQNLDKTPLEYKTGDHFSVRYLVSAWSRHPTAPQLEERHSRWLKEAAAK
jgi:hypothetical protein